jgi:hypothetical protein
MSICIVLFLRVQEWDIAQENNFTFGELAASQQHSTVAGSLRRLA